FALPDKVLTPPANRPATPRYIDPMSETENYLVDVIGFNQTERLLLSSIFGLAARRAPSFLQRDAKSLRPADLYLVDGDDASAMNDFRAVRARYPAPAGRGGAPRGGLPAVPRPLQWARLLQSFDDAMQGGAPAPADYEKTMVLRRTSTSAPAA